jgi:hypothetical protein
MKPSYEEITEANPRLKNRPKEDVEKLMDTIISKGYFWDDKKKYFYHEKLGMHVRTQGLDIFDPERFEKTFETWSNPKFSEEARTAHKWIPRLLIIFFLDLILGWLLMSIKVWIASFVFIGLLISLNKDAFKIIREKIKS